MDNIRRMGLDLIYEANSGGQQIFVGQMCVT